MIVKAFRPVKIGDRVILPDTEFEARQTWSNASRKVEPESQSLRLIFPNLKRTNR
jgi:hypothetical protein